MSKRVVQALYRDFYGKKTMVPVLNIDNKPLMPCSEKRAKKLMDKGEAIPYWQKGFFAIKLIKEPSQTTFRPVALGIDPGSMREGYTVLTEEAVGLNLLTDTPYWVKGRVESRRRLRRARRYRKTPYRACRSNRSVLRKTNRIPPSTRAYWGARLRIVKHLLKLFPITIINVEDIKAKTRENNSSFNKQYNKTFSPLEVGKNWFYDEIQKLGVELILTSGYETAEYRKRRGFTKLPKKEKLVDKWEAHNVDSHCLAEMSLRKEVEPFKQLWKLNFYQFRKRQLHVEKPTKGGKRKRHGGTVSLGMSRGSVVKYKEQLVYLGGSSKNKLSVHDLKTKNRITESAKREEIKIMYQTSCRVSFLTSKQT